MSNIEELIKIIENAIKNRSDVVLDPYDYALLMRILDLEDAIKLYNSLSELFPEAIEDNIAEPHEIILTYDGRLFRRIIKRLNKFR